MKKTILTLSSILLGAALSPVGAEENAAPERPAAPAEHREPSRRQPLPGNSRKFRTGSGIWQVFSQLSPEERREMQKLQRSDPAKFQEVMQTKADELFRKRQARMNELLAMAEKCRAAATAKERDELRAKLAAEVEKDFRGHLAANRRHLEEMKRRAERMEKELNRREANCSKVVAAMVEKMIRDGKIPPPPHQKPRRDKEQLEK